jgi:phosphoheptose isomerase
MPKNNIRWLNLVEKSSRDDRFEFPKPSQTYYELLEGRLSWLSTVDIQKVCDILINSKVVFTAGNGGSSGNASHLACEIQKGCGIPTVCLNESIQLITAWSNDYGYVDAARGQYSVLSTSVTGPHTVVVFSGSGESGNLVRLVEDAIVAGAHVIAFTGYDNRNSEGDYHNTLDMLCKNYDKGVSLCVGISKWIPDTEKVNSIGMQISEDLHASLVHMIYLELERLVRSGK